MKRMEQGTKVNCGHTCLAMMVDDHDLTQVNAVLGHDGSNPDDQGNPLGLTEAEAVLFLYRRGCLPLWVKGKLQEDAASPRRRLIPDTKRIFGMIADKRAMIMPELRRARKGIGWHGMGTK